MKETKNTNTTKIAGALILGAAIGALLGFLFAPEKGCETRRKLFKGARNVADNLNKNKGTDSFTQNETD